MSKVITTNEANFNTDVTNSTVPVLLDFYADWCPPCKALSPILNALAAKRTDIKIVKVDIDQNRDLAAHFNIRSIPTLYLVKDKKVITQHNGPRSESALDQWITAQLKK